MLFDAELDVLLDIAGDMGWAAVEIEATLGEVESVVKTVVTNRLADRVHGMLRRGAKKAPAESRGRGQDLRVAES